MHFAGLRIVFSENALEATDERTFPASKNRSARIRKKLIKRHGGEFRKKPCIWQIGHQIIAHPSFRASLVAAAQKPRHLSMAGPSLTG